MGDGRSSEAEDVAEAWGAAKEFDRTYPVGSRVLVRSLRVGDSPLSAEVVSKAYAGGWNSPGDVCVRVRVTEDKQGVTYHSIDATRVLGPAPLPPVPGKI